MIVPEYEPASWTEFAACNGKDPDLFFPVKGDYDSMLAAKEICATCDVRQECLDYALRNKERYGVWGGLSERQRRRLRSNPARLGPIKNHGTEAGAQSHYRRGEALCADCRAAQAQDRRDREERGLAPVSHNHSVVVSGMDERTIAGSV